METAPYINVPQAEKIKQRDDAFKTAKVYDEKAIFDALKKLPDFDRFPLPKNWYSMFNLPPPKIPTLKEALKLHYETQLAFINSPDYPEVEIRPPAEGGIRPIPEGETPEVTVIPGKTLKDLDNDGNLIENETPSSEESK